MAAPDEQALPSGRVTFLFTDIEGSTVRWEREPRAMNDALEQHNSLLRDVIHGNRGVIFKHTGDGVAAVFASFDDALRGAIEAQRAIQSAEWDSTERLRVRIGLHTGEALPTDGDYFGPAVNRTARVMDLANGDQITVSGSADDPANLDVEVDGDIAGVELRPMGLHQLKGIGTEDIRMVFAPGLVVDDRPLRSHVGRPSKRLPSSRHRLIGRDVELDQLMELLDRHAAATIVGPGGVGKTSLALEVGRRTADRYADGVVFCDLVQLTDPNDVPTAVAEALGARVQPGMGLVESIVDFVHGREILIVLDNCEHVRDVARLVGTEILRSDATILATSREPVGWDLERVFELGPLDPATDGMELFVERARERDRSFDPAAADRERIVELCGRIDGLPLAIELAAPWTRVLSMAQLTERLEDRLRVPREDEPDERHRTLSDTVRWSYQQLTDDEARLFTRLSVFAGGFSIDAVEEVCRDDEITGDTLDLIMRLVETSMVTTRRGTGRIRFDMLDTLRRFGADELARSGSETVVRRRHATYYADLARTCAARLISSKEAEVWDELDQEWANLRTAFDTLLEVGRIADAAALVIDLGWFAGFSMRFEAFSWADELFEHDVESMHDLASLWGLRALGQYFTAGDRAVEYAKRGLAVDDADRHGFCRAALAAVSLNNVHTAEESEELTTAWLDNLSPDAPLSDRLWAEGMRTFHLCTHRPSPEAADHAGELMRLAIESESASAMALARWAGGMVASYEGPDKAMEEWWLGLDSARSLDAGHLLIPLITGLELHFAAARGELADVVVSNLAALEDAQERHYLAGTSHLFGVTAIVLSRAGRAEVGARLLGAMVANGHLPRGNARRAVERELGDDVGAAMDAGSRLSIDEAAELAIETLRNVQQAGARRADQDPTRSTTV